MYRIKLVTMELHELIFIQGLFMLESASEIIKMIDL